MRRQAASGGGRRRVAAVLSSGWVGYGPQCEEFERRGGSGVATSSCTAALYPAALLSRDADRDGDAADGDAADATAVPEAIVPRGIATALHYPSLAMHPTFAADADPHAADAADDVLTLPTSLALGAETQERIAAAIATACARR